MDITEIVTLVLKLMLAIATAFVIPAFKKKIDAEKLAEARKWVKIAVEAAEMIYDGFEMGETKKAFVNDFLARKGLKLSTDEIDKLIEAAVLEMNNAIWG